VKKLVTYCRYRAILLPSDSSLKTLTNQFKVIIRQADIPHSSNARAYFKSLTTTKKPMAIKLTGIDLLTRYSDTETRMIKITPQTTSPNFMKNNSRTLKIAALRRAIHSGSYKINSQRVARKLLQQDHELLGLWR
jgi:anti-sigma28 factor (negative regulator of flagellin synthesis)